MKITAEEEYYNEKNNKPWLYLYNSFAYVDEFFTSLLNKATGAEEETKSSREKLMDRMSR